jgi:hypothetical protein
MNECDYKVRRGNGAEYWRPSVTGRRPHLKILSLRNGFLEELGQPFRAGSN